MARWAKIRKKITAEGRRDTEIAEKNKRKERRKKKKERV